MFQRALGLLVMTMRNDRVMIVERDIIHPQRRLLNAPGASLFVRRQVLEQTGAAKKKA
jgi:hypothetical protein